MFIAESTPSTVTGHGDTFALILTLVIGFWFNVIEYTSIDPETNTTVTVYKKGALRFFSMGFFDSVSFTAHGVSPWETSELREVFPHGMRLGMLCNEYPQLKKKFVFVQN